jgi:hypothetical protein
MIFDISKKSVNICQILADIYKCIMIVLFVIMSVLGNEIQEAGMEKQVIQVYHVIRKRDHPAILGQHSPIATRRWNTILSSAYHCLEQKKAEQVRTSPTKVKIALHHLTIRIPTTLNGSIKVLATRGVKESTNLYT